MAFYKKKPVVIEAVQWNGKNINEIKDFGGEDIDVKVTKSIFELVSSVTIHTLKGDIIASVGDYIIKGASGEYYLCKPELFNEIYEAADPVENS